MEPNLSTQKPASETGHINIFKWPLLIFLSIVTFATYFWVVFYSDLFANLTLISHARNWYQSVYIKTQSFVNPTVRVYSIYTIKFTDSFGKGIYAYTFYGTFVSFDSNNDILALQGIDGKNYNFTTGGDLFMSTDNNGTGSFRDNSPGSNKTKTNIVNSGTAFVTPQSVIQISWDDTRTLYQIDRDHSKNNSVPLNQNSNKIFILTKYK